IMFISDECVPTKLDLREIKIKIGNGGSVYPGDTLDVYLSYKDKNGTEQKFNKNSVFEAGLISGCGAAKILNKNGELKQFFHRIQEPIRIVILDYEDSDWNDRNVNIRIGFISEGE
ncbi:MAG: hypothetical protein IH620_03285, partial [Ignavibacterium sp.]|nr:hypothetical protein [Ignavibacterium sp.]